jgi:hypothetical protein
LTTDANIQCLPSTDTPNNGDLYPRIFQGSLLYKFYCPQPWFSYVSQRRSLQRGFRCEYVVARAITCPIFRRFVYLCETSLSNCKPIMHFKHSYMHNHAFYVLIRLIILLYHAYMLHSQFHFSIQLNLHSQSISTFNSIQFNSISISNSTQFQFPVSIQSQFQFNSISTVKLNSISTFNPISMPI